MFNLGLSRGQKDMLLATFLFSLMNIFVKWISHVPFVEIVFFRQVIQAAGAYYFIRRAGIYPWGKRKDLLIIRGILGTAGLTAYFYTVQRMPLVSAVTIQYLAPIFTILLATWISKEHTSFKQVIFFCISFVGVIVLKGFNSDISTFDLCMGVFAALCSGSVYTVVRETRKTEDPMVVVFYFSLVTLPVMAPFAYEQWSPLSLWEWTCIFGTGLTTFAAQFFMTRSYHVERADRVSQLTYLGPILAIVYGFSLFNESLQISTLLGVGLILAGVYFSSKKPTQS